MKRRATANIFIWIFYVNCLVLFYCKLRFVIPNKFFTTKMVILFAVDNSRNFFNATERDESTVDLRVMKIQEIVTQIKLGHAEYTRACFFTA